LHVQRNSKEFRIGENQGNLSHDLRRGRQSSPGIALWSLWMITLQRNKYSKVQSPTWQPNAQDLTGSLHVRQLHRGASASARGGVLSSVRGEGASDRIFRIYLVFFWTGTTVLIGHECLSSVLLNAKTTFRRQNQKDSDLPCRLFIGNGCFNLTAGRTFWKREKRAVRNKGLQDALLRSLKTFVLCNRKPSYSVLWSVLGVARSWV